MAPIELKATASKVHAVTVFRADRAEVVRLFSVDLKEGQNEVDISQLPTVLDEDSIRVDGIGGNAIISDVIYHPPASNDSDKKHEKAVKELQREKKNLEQELAIHEKQASVLETYAATLKGADTGAAKLDSFLDIYAVRQAEINVKTRELKEKIAAVDEKITAEREVWSADDESKKRAVRITIVISAEEDGHSEISLTYLVSRASWKPLYDLRATVGAEKTAISLQYRATITQSTGEDWKDVELTLSTASPQLGSTIPTLGPLRIDPIVYTRRAVKSKGGFGFGGSMKKESAYGSTEMARSGAPMAQAYFAVREAAAVEGMISTSYVIGGLSTIPTDTDQKSEEHKVTVAIIDLKADLEWITVPKVQPSAFLQAKIKNTSEYLLLPGRANVFLDDNFVAKSDIDNVSPNETFDCSLGVDPQVKVTYHPITKKTKSQGGLLTTSTNTTSSLQKITIKNVRSAPIRRLLVRDQIPISSDQRLKVALTEPADLDFSGRNTISASGTSTSEKPKELRIAKGVTVRWKPSEAELADESSTPGLDGAREGIIEWMCEIAAGTSRDLTLAWDVTAPAKLNWGPNF